MRSRIITFVVSLLLWLLLSFSLDIQHLAMGVFISLVVAFMMGDMFTGEAHKWFQVRRYFWFLTYIFLFIWECIKANIDVALRVLNPRLPIKPGIVRIKTSLQTETALTFLANSITLTPGTISVDVNKEKGIIYIHWIDVKTEDIDEATRIISSRFERILKEVFE